MFSLRNKFCYGTIAVFPDIGEVFLGNCISVSHGNVCLFAKWSSLRFSLSVFADAGDTQNIFV